MNLFVHILTQLLLRLSLDHPYHTLSVLLALANASKDDELSTPSSGSTGTSKLSKKQSNSKKPSNSTIDKVTMRSTCIPMHTNSHIRVSFNIHLPLAPPLKNFDCFNTFNPLRTVVPYMRHGNTKFDTCE